MKLTTHGYTIEGTPQEIAQLIDIITKPTLQPIPPPWPTYPEPYPVIYPTVIYSTDAITSQLAPDGSIDYPAWTTITRQFTKHLEDIQVDVIPSFSTNDNTSALNGSADPGRA